MVQPNPRNGGRLPRVLLAGAVVIGAGVTVGLLLKHGDGNAPAAEGRPAARRPVADADLVRLKSDAEALALAGRYAEAQEKYRELQRVAAGRDTGDVETRTLLSRASSDRERIDTILFNGRRGADPATIVDPTKTGPPAVAAPTSAAPLAAVPSAQANPVPPALASASPPAAPFAAAPPPVAGPAVSATPPPAPASPAEMVSSALVHRIPTGNPPEAAEWLPQASAIAPNELTDEQVNRSIRRGVDFLLSQYKDGRVATVDPNLTQNWREGLDALCDYALLQASQATRDDRLKIRGPFMTDMLAKLTAAPMEADVSGRWGPVVYARSLRAMALAVYNRPADRDTLKDDAVFLVDGEVLGGYFYDDRYSQGRGHRSDLPDPPPPESDKPRLIQKGDIAMRGMWVGQGGGSGKGTGRFIMPKGWSFPPSWPISYPLPPGGFNPPPRAPAPPPPMRSHGTPSVRPAPPSNPPAPSSNPPPSNKPAPGGDIDISSFNRGKYVDKDPALTREEVPWDNSTSQFGVLGVLACAEAGIEIPTWFWQDVDYHWQHWQMPDGGWGYRQTSQISTQAMTSGGVTALHAVGDWSGATMGGAPLGRDPFGPRLGGGIAWLEHADNGVATGAAGSRFASYDLLSLERAAMAIGFKHLGRHEWYRELAAGTIARQWPDGSWGGAGGNRQGAQDHVIETAFTLLFLSRGQHPVMMNKLRFAGPWSNRPHDAANLSSYVGRTLERPVNWQVVGLDRPWTDWLDSPILYIASQQAPKFTDADLLKLRQYAEAGGLIFTHADGGSAAFNQFAADLAKKLWPAYELRPLPDDHDLYAIHTKLTGRPHPKLQGLGNGARLLMVHSPADISGAWEMRADKSRPESFQLAMNLFAYASGKSDVRHRLDVTYLVPPTDAPKRTIKIARLKYAGAWDPEPLAWTRFSRWLQSGTGVAADCAAVDVAALKPGDAAVAHLTGASPYDLTAAEAAALRAYVEAGGVLLVDSCGGASFGESVRKSALAISFSDVKFTALSADDAVLQASVAAGTADLSKPKYRNYLVAKAATQPSVIPIEHAAVGKGHVYFSTVDLTSGLLGTQTWGIYGFEPEYATALVKNILLSAGARTSGQ